MNFEEFAMPLLKGYIGAEAYYAGSMLKAVWDKDYKEALTMKKKLEKGAFFPPPDPHPSSSQTVGLVGEAVRREFVPAEEESLPFEENA